MTFGAQILVVEPKSSDISINCRVSRQHLPTQRCIPLVKPDGAGKLPSCLLSFYMQAATHNQLREGTIVVIRAFYEVPEHLFETLTVEEDCVTGTAVSSQLAGSYSEPEFSMIVSIRQR